MQIHEFIIRIIEVLRWPVVVVIIAFLFRRQIGALILRTTKLRYGNAEAEFGQGLIQVESMASEAGIPTISPTKTERPPEEPLYRAAIDIPRASVTEAWRRLETVLNDSASRMDIPTKRPAMRSTTSRKVIKRLIDDGKVMPGTLEVLDKLKRLRNIAAHSLEYELDSNEAARYVDIALSLANTIRSAVNEE